MSSALKEKVVLVTGSASGIGKGIAKRLVIEEAIPVLIDINESTLKRTIVELEKVNQSSNKLGYIIGDIRNQQFLNEIIKYVDKEFGKIDALVNCAGIFPSNPALKIDEDEWDRVFDINVKAAFFLSQKVANYIIKKEVKRSVILNITSVASEVARPGISHYASSKAALKMLTQVMALEFAAYGIRVNALGPGLVETETLLKTLNNEKAKKEHEEKISYCPMRRTVSISEIADAAMFLLGDQSTFITGQNILIDGGYSAGRVYHSFE